MGGKASYADYGSIVDNLLIRNATKGQQVFLIASCGDSDGKTTTAINVARAMAQNGRATLLMDLDFVKPEITTLLGIKGLGEKPDPDAADIEEEYDPARPYDCGNNLWVFPGNMNSAFRIKQTFLDPEQGKDTMEAFKSEFAFIIVDTTSGENNLYTKYLAGLADAALIVVRAYKTIPGEVSALARKLEESGIETMGMVLNKRKEYVPRILQKIFLGS
jgi:Mrp family chromosome partitioning ATPase